MTLESTEPVLTAQATADTTVEGACVEPADDRIGVTALERGLGLLDALGAARIPLQTQRPPTVLRLAVSLERFGHLRRDSVGNFHLGPALWRLGTAFRQNLDLEQHVRPVLEALVSLTQESASFWIPHGNQRMCLYRVNSPRSARSHVEEGEHSPIDKGAGGHIVAYHLGKPTPRASEIEADAAVATVGDRDPDVASVAAAVLGPNREFLGALVLAGILSRFEPRIPDFKPIVKQAAQALSRQVGGGTEAR